MNQPGSKPSRQENAPQPADAGTSASGYRDRPWIPRFWTGMSARGWWSLLWRNRFAVHPARWGMAAILSFASLVNCLLATVQALWLGRRISRTEVPDEPIFIIGHWRSGTTLLHELLVLDPRHTFPDTFSCFCPNHFLLFSWLFRPLLGLLLPKRRPMDNMAAGWDHPQEDEFALCNMGLPSPYLMLLFPNRPRPFEEYYELAEVPAPARQRWKRGLRWFVQCLTLRRPGRVVLKSPTHTFRIRVLLEMFPKARFVHIVRDPLVVFPSTVKLWKRLSADQGLQIPRHEGLEEHVLRTFERMYEVFERDRGLIPPGQFCEVRFEELVADPVGQVRRIYEELQLGGFDQVLPALEAYAQKQQDYRPNRYQLAPEEQAEIQRRWGRFIEQYGYSPSRAGG